MRTLRITVGLLLAGVPAWTATITTTQSGISQVEVGGVKVAESSDAKTDGFVSVFAIYGSQTTPEARTAARSGDNEMAANARIDDKLQFSGTNFSTVLSQASFTLQLAADNVFVRHGIVDFVLPASYLEVTASIELPIATVDTVILADLRYCLSVACTLADTVFHLQANLEASYNHESHAANATGNPQLDLTPFPNAVVTTTDTPSGFLRTYHFGFPLFQGHLDMGNIPSGTPVTLEYIMQARASGVLIATLGISSVNDPFLLDTDPVQHFTPLTLSAENVSADVPEPGGVVACLIAAAVLAYRFRGRRRMGGKIW